MTVDRQVRLTLEPRAVAWPAEGEPEVVTYSGVTVSRLETATGRADLDPVGDVPGDADNEALIAA